MNYRTFGTAFLLSLIATSVHAQQGLPAFNAGLQSILGAIQVSSLTIATIGFAVAGVMMYFGRGLEWLNKVFWGSVILGAAGAFAAFSQGFS